MVQWGETTVLLKHPAVSRVLEKETGCGSMVSPQGWGYGRAGVAKEDKNPAPEAGPEHSADEV